MAFPTLLPNCKRDSTNNALPRDFPLPEQINHLMKFAEIVNGNSRVAIADQNGTVIRQRKR